jgi:hypothetical protein
MSPGINASRSWCSWKGVAQRIAMVASSSAPFQTVAALKPLLHCFVPSRYTAQISSKRPGRGTLRLLNSLRIVCCFAWPCFLSQPATRRCSPRKSCSRRARARRAQLLLGVELPVDRGQVEMLGIIFAHPFPELEVLSMDSHTLQSVGRGPYMGGREACRGF